MQINRLLLFLLIFICGYSQAEDLYWVGNSGNWNDPSHWSLNSGGLSANKIPNAQDQVIFDQNSFDLAYSKVIFGDVKVRSLSINNSLTPVFEGSSIEISEGLNIEANMALVTALIFNSSTIGTKVINTSGYLFASDIEIRSGTWSLQNHLVLADNSDLNISCDAFFTNGFSLKAGNITVEKTKFYAENSAIYAVNSLDLRKASNKGEHVKIYNKDAFKDTSLLINQTGSNNRNSSNTCGGLTLTLTTSDYNGASISCNGACDGQITVVPSGTPGGFSYSFNNINGPYAATNVFSNLCPGTYTIFVMDSSNVIIPGVFGICSVSDNLVDPPVLSIGVIAFVDPSCHNVCDGQVFTSISGGTSPINAVWDSGDTGSNPTNLCVGDNTVTLTDTNGCMETSTVNLSAPLVITADIDITLPTCNGDSDGALTISNETGGNGGPYTYNYSPAPAAGQGTNNPTGYSSGNVTVSLFDVDGCQEDTLITIPDPPELFANTVNPLDATCFGFCDGSITALPVGGISGYTFEWFDDGTGLTTGNTDSIATGLCAGDYFVAITDANGCTRNSLPVTIGEPTEMTFTFTNTDVACKDSCTGIATATVVGGAGGYVYSWIDIATNMPVGGNNATVANLCPGSYEITVSDANGCISTPDTAIILNALPLDIVFTSTTPDCYDICNGEITATPTNSTGFQYQWDHGPTTQTITGLCVAGDYIVEVTDDSGCVEIDTFNLVVPDVYDITVNTTDLICFENSDGAIDLTVNLGGNGGPYTYTWTPGGITGDGTPNVSGLVPGDYTVLISDGPGTCDTALTITLTSPIDLTIVGADISQISCNGACDGQISALPAGGTPGYTYQWIDDATSLVISTDSIIMNLCAGDYYVRVTDANGCLDSSSIITIIEPTPIVLITAGYDLSCFDICDGAVTADVTGGSPNYDYLWRDIATNTNVGITDSISGLCPGQYELIVTDATGCSTPADTVTVSNAPQLSLNLVGTDLSCFGTCDGAITATLTNGVGAITWTPAPNLGQGTANAIYNNLCANFYTIDIVDDNGCVISDTITIHDAEPYVINVNQGEISCFGGSDGFIDLDVISGGTGGVYTYSWLPPGVAGAGTDSIFNLSTGFYQVTISDGTCDTTMLFTLNDPVELTATASVISQSFCAGDCSGSGDIVAAGGTPNYGIQWNSPGNPTTNVIANLCAGTYIGTITDALGCIAIDSIIITEPLPYNFTVATTDNNCFGLCEGTATINGLTGGTGPYSIQWNDPLNQTGNMATNLCAGIYQATISDLNNCDSIITVTIMEPVEITFTTNLVDGSCFGSCSGETSITVVGGAIPLNYEWFNVNSNIAIANADVNPNLCAGDYYAVVTDNDGCAIISDTLTITEFPEIFVDLVSSTDATCGVNDGDATIAATGGTGGGFTYSWSPIPPVGAGTPAISNLSGGVYTVTVTDITSGCADSLAVPISSGALEVLTTDSVDVSCFGALDGEVDVNFTCIELACSIEWFDEGGNSIGNANTITGLPAGLYLVELTNGLGCTVIDSTRILDAQEIVVSITSTDIACFGDANGTADVIATGGAGGLQYNWVPAPNGGQATPNATGLTAGTWTMTVTDIDNCSVDISTDIIEPAELVLDLVTATNISCFGTNDGTLGAAASGGTGTISYEWFSCISGISVGTTPGLTGLAPGEYFVVVTDGSACTVISACIEIEDYQEITAIFATTTVTCFGDCNGEIAATPSGGDGNYFYQWQDEFFVDIAGQTNITINNICQGQYNLVITDGNGCTATLGPVDLTSPNAPWDVTLTENGVNCNGDCDGTATVTVNSGNVGPYTYLWNDPFAQTFATATNLCAGSYDVVISDAGVCDTTITVVISDTAAIATNGIRTDIDCNGDCTGEVVLAPTGGTPPYAIVWSDTQAGTTASNLCSGNITASLIDDVGCTVDTTFTIVEPLIPLTVTSSFVNITQCGQCNGSATVNVSGGTGTYTYVWSEPAVIGQGTNHVSGLCAGLISVEITDLNGCSIIESFVIQDADGEIFTLTNGDASCFGVCDGTASINYICNSPVCSQIWINANTGMALAPTGTSVTTLCAGDYIVQLTNGLGCVSAENFTIGSPDEIIIDETITPITCGGASDGIISVVTTGGSGAGYTLDWTPVPANGQGANPATGLGPNTYDLIVTDGNLCTATETYVLVDTTPIAIVTTVTDATCNGICDGTISAAVSGGYGNYTYQWFFNGGLMVGEIAPAIFGLCPGSYSLTVTDGNGCSETIAAPIVIIEPTPIVIIIGDEDINCFGDCDGMVFVTPSGGGGGYNYNWFDGLTNTLIGQANDTAFNLCSGDYYAEITDINNCMVTSSFATITEPTELLFTLDHQDINCFEECDATGVITPTGGVPDYTYQWLNNLNVPIGTDSMISNLCVGAYTVEAIDDNGCTTGPQLINVIGPQELTANVFTNNADCNVASGSATAAGVGGLPTYTFQWLDNAQLPLIGETNATLSNVFSGTYYVEITDANLCVDTFEVDIIDNPSTTLVFDAVNDPTCFGSSDGNIEISVIGNLPLNFLWTPGGMVVEDPNNLSAGAYHLEITDAFGCVSHYDTTLFDPPEIIVVSNLTPPTCGECDGEIETTVSGGVGVLNLNWNSGQTVDDIQNLCPGIYELNITDDNGCFVNEQIALGNSSDVAATPNITPISCFDACDGAITIDITAGIAPFTVNWLNDGFVGPIRTNLCPDTYLVEVIDSAGCILPLVIELVNPVPLDIVESFTLPNCGVNDGEISVVVTGGVGNPTFSWTNSASTTSTASGLGAGIYILTVTDDFGNGCSQDLTFELSNSTVPQVELTAIDLNCADICDGSITSVVAGGTPGYTYQWLDEFGVILIGETNPDLLNLCAGEYFIEVTDFTNCKAYASDVINSPDSLNFNSPFVNTVSCNGDCDGSIGALILGGVVPYDFAWDDPNNQTTAAATGLCDGTYNLVVTDANNCIITLTDSIVEPDVLSIVVDTIIAAECQSSTDGEIQITVNGGTPDFTYQWVSADNDTLTTEDINNLIPSTFYLTVTDVNGCFVQDTVIMDPATVVAALAGNDTLICFGEDANLTGSSNQPNADFTWFDLDNSIISDTNTLFLTGLVDTLETYILQASFNGCVGVDTVVVTIPILPFVDAGPDDEIPSLGAIQIGGDPSANTVDTLFWSPSIYLDDSTLFNPTAIKPKEDTWYYVTVIDSNGCVNVDSMFLEVIPDIRIPSGISPNGDGKNDTWQLQFKEDFPNLEVSVYNRWGDLLFYDNTSYLIEWDGSFKGSPLPVGTYYYVVDLHSEFYPEPYTGPLTIMR